MEALLLVGGQSSRMGSRKELLLFPDGRPAIDHALETLHSAMSRVTSIHISLHSKSQLPDLQARWQDPDSLTDCPGCTTAADVHMSDGNLDEVRTPRRVFIFDDQEQNVGPASGLLAAHSMLPDSTFLVLGCDYPRLPPRALHQLINEYTGPVTCFVNEEGYCEPLVAIWSPEALEQLKKNVGQGMSGLNRVVKQMGGKLLKPLNEDWIKGANTREEWREAMLSLSLSSDE